MRKGEGEVHLQQRVPLDIIGISVGELLKLAEGQVRWCFTRFPRCSDISRRQPLLQACDHLSLFSRTLHDGESESIGELPHAIDVRRVTSGHFDPVIALV